MSLYEYHDVLQNCPYFLSTEITLDIYLFTHITTIAVSILLMYVTGTLIGISQEAHKQLRQTD